jgi:hypothetical protein
MEGRAEEEVAGRGESVVEGNAAAFDGLEKSFVGPAAKAQDTEDETVVDEEVGTLESAFRDLTVDTKSILGEGAFAKVMVASRPGGKLGDVIMVPSRRSHVRLQHGNVASSLGITQCVYSRAMRSKKSRIRSANQTI